MGNYSSGLGGYINLTESGGTYPYNNGTISGSVVGCKFIGSWHEDHRSGRPSDYGPCEFSLSEDGLTMFIKWGWAGESLEGREYSESASRVQ